MIIGLCGPHRSGKTSLARELSHACRELTYFPHLTSVLAGRDSMVVDMTDQERMCYQYKLLRAQTDVLTMLNADISRHYVIDRTPVDTAAYTAMYLANSEEFRDGVEVQAFRQQALHLHSTQVYVTLFIESSPHFVPEEGKATEEQVSPIREDMRGMLHGIENVLVVTPVDMQERILIGREGVKKLEVF